MLVLSEKQDASFPLHSYRVLPELEELALIGEPYSIAKQVHLAAHWVLSITKAVLESVPLLGRSEYSVLWEC